MSDQPTSPSLSERTRRWIPLVVFLLALLVRLPGMSWGLMDANHNQSLHPDEEVNWRYSQQIRPAEFHFTPGFYNYGTLYLTALRVSSDITAAYTGKPTKPTNDWDYIRRCELAGRIISLLSGAALAVCVYLMATRFTSAIGSFSAAFAIIVAPALVVHSRFATVDMLSVFLISWSMLLAIKLYYEAEASTKLIWRWAIFSGVLAGLSAGTKYSGGLAVLMPITALILRKPPKWAMMSVATVGATIVAFLISTPGAILENEAFIRDFKFESAHTAAGHGIVFVGTSIGYLFHLSNLALGQGLLLLALGLAGLIYALVKKQPWAIITIALWLPYYLLIGSAEVKFMRYTFPLMIGTSLAVGYAIGEGHRLKGKGALAVVIGILGFGGFAGGGLRGSATFTGDMLGPDNREVAANYIKEKSTESTVAGVARDPWYWSATLFPDSALTRMFPFSTRYEVMAAATKPKVVQYIPANPEERLDWDTRLLTEMHPDYVVFSDLESLDVQRLASMAAVPAENQAVVARYKAFETELEKGYTLDKQIGEQTDLVEDMLYVAPAVYIWKRKGS